MADRVTLDNVQRWVEDFGLTHQPHPMDDDPSFEWVLLVRGQAFSSIVAQRRADFNYLAIQATISISEDHREAWRTLPDDDRQSFLYDLQLALHTQSIGHAIEFEPDGSGDRKSPVQVTIGTNLTEEPIRRSDFFGRNHTVQSGARIVALMFQKMAHQGHWS